MEREMLDLAKIPCTKRDITVREHAGEITSFSLSIEIPADSPYQRRIWDSGFCGLEDRPELLTYNGIEMTVTSATGNGLGAISGKPMTFQLHARFPLPEPEREEPLPKDGDVLVYDEALGRCRPMAVEEVEKLELEPSAEPPILTAVAHRAADDFEVIRARQREMAEERAPKDFLRFVHPETGTVYLKPVSDRAEVAARYHPDNKLLSDPGWYAFDKDGCPWDGSGEITLQDIDCGPNI